MPQLYATDQKGNLLIQDLWYNGTESVHNEHVVNTDTKSHSVKTLEKCLQEAERANKKMYLEARLQQRQHFSPFVTSVDGLLVVEVSATLKMIAIHLAKKVTTGLLQDVRIRQE